MNNKSDVWVLFNTHTIDGKAAAFACWSKMRGHPVYRGVGYDTIGLIPHVLTTKLQTLYILGLHLTKSDLEKMSDCAHEIIFIDSTSFKDFEYGGCKYSCKSIEGRSACTAAFGHFHSDRELPLVYNHIEDVDMNTGRYVNSLYIYYGIQCELLDAVDDQIFLKAGLFLDPSHLPNLAADGYAFYQHITKLSRAIAQNYQSYDLSYNGSILKLLAINCNKVFNKVIAQNVPDFDILLMYEDSIPAGITTTIRSWTVVSRYEHIPASKIAVRHGGYGSQKVAGFVTSLQDPITIVGLIKEGGLDE